MEKTKYIRIEGFEPDKKFMRLPNVIDELNKQRENREIDEDYFVLAVITHNFEDTDLPIELDYIFQEKNVGENEFVNIVIRGCFNYGQKFHTKLWQGYNHLAILELKDANAQFVKNLKPYKMKTKWDPNFILCQNSEADFCKALIQNTILEHERFMQDQNAHIGEKSKKEEQEYYKRNE